MKLLNCHIPYQHVREFAKCRDVKTNKVRQFVRVLNRSRYAQRTLLKLITYILKCYAILCFYIPASCSTSGSNHMPIFDEYLVLSRCRLRSHCSLLERQFLGLLFEKQGKNRNVRLVWLLSTNFFILFTEKTSVYSLAYNDECNLWFVV